MSVMLETDMSATLVTPQEVVQPVESVDTLRRWVWTRDEVDRLQANGAFDGQRWELIEGELYDKMSQNPPHSNARRKLVEWLRTLFQPGTVDTQCPIQVPAADREYSLPEPDAVVFLHPVIENRHPRADEVLLVAEVSDTSLRFDLSVKAGLYARSAIPEYWVVDLVNRRLIVCRNPTEGVYRDVKVFAETESVSTATRPEAAIPVTELLPPPADEPAKPPAS